MVNWERSKDGHTMTKTAAIAAARSSVVMYRQGSGWICGSWNKAVDAWELEGEQPYQLASYAAQSLKLTVALRLRGRSQDEIDYLIADRYPGEPWESLVS